MKRLTKRNVLLSITALLGIVVILSVSSYLIGNTTVGYYDGVEQSSDGYGVLGIGPCEADKLTTNQNIRFVFTKPFKTLDSFEDAEILKKVNISNGKVNLSLLPGKYGLYAELENGKKELYGDLILGNPKNDRPRNEQGPWYVIINPLRNNLSFRSSIPC